MTHSKTFVPTPRPATAVTGDSEFVMVPLPDIWFQTPVPTIGVFPFRVVFGEVMHKLWLTPALEIVGASSTCIKTVEDDAVQGELEIVHWKMFVPKPRPVIAVAGDKEFVMVPLPEIKLHVPTPTTGELAAIMIFGFEMQIFCVGPAMDAVGISFTIIATVEDEAAQGELEMVHSKIVVPKPSPVTEVVGERELVMVPLPEIKLQDPTPTRGTFAVIVVPGLVMQSV